MATDKTAKHSGCSHESSRSHALTIALTLKRIFCRFSNSLKYYEIIKRIIRRIKPYPELSFLQLKLGQRFPALFS